MIETSITGLLSECPSFKSKPNYWADRGTEKHEELSSDDGIMKMLDIVEEKLKVKIKNILDIEGMTTPEHENIIVSTLGHRQGKKAYSLTLQTKDGVDVTLSGVPDVVLELEDGRVMIVDHKSGGKIHSFKQVACYGLMAARAWEKTEGALLVYIHHDMLDGEMMPIVRSRNFTNQDLEEVFSDIEELIDKKLSLALKATSYCRYCINRDKCPEIMLENMTAPSDLSFNDKVLWYITNKGRASIQADTIKQIGDEIIISLDMGEQLPDFAKLKERKGSDIDTEALQKDYPDVRWVTHKPLGVTEIRKLAKQNDIDLSGYTTEKITARFVEAS